MKAKKIFTVFAILMFLISISTIVFAQQVRERFENAKEKFLETKEKFEEAKTKWNNIRERYLNQRRIQERNEFLNQAHNYLLKSTEHFINYLEMTKSRTQKIENLEEADLNEIVSQINAQIAKLEVLKAKIQNTDANNLSIIAQEVKAEWNTAKVFSKKIVGLILAANTQKSINIAEKIALRAEERINDLNASDTNAFAELTAFRQRIELAKQLKEQAIVKFMQISNSDSNSVQVLFNEGHDLLKEAHKELSKAHRSLKDIIKEIVKAKNLQNQNKNRINASETD